MMKNQNYWRRRFEDLERLSVSNAERYEQTLSRAYSLAFNEIERDITRWYERLAANNNVDLAGARTLLSANELEEFTWTVEEYIQRGIENAVNQRWIRQLENASARVHISRLEALKLQIQHKVQILTAQEQRDITNLFDGIYKDRFYRTAYEVQKGFNLGWSFPMLDNARIDKVLNTPWVADGLNFSDRIWGNKANFIATLETELTQSLMRGESPHKLISRISDEFGVDKRRTGRLVMTESAYFASAGQKDCFNELGVEWYEIVATLDNKTSEICQGLDGKIEKMTNFEIGVTAPPFHPWCRTTTVPYFEDNPTERWYRDEQGDVGYVDGNMKYKEWSEKYLTPKLKYDRIQISGEWWEQAKFYSPRSFEKHIKDHLNEFGNITENEYLHGARNLLSAELSEDILGFIDEDGAIFKYNIQTNEFAIGHQKGHISTYYKPKRGIEYWKEQIEKYG